MLRQILITILALGALNCGVARAQNLPSQLMRAASPTIPPGYTLRWIYKVEMTSSDKSDVDRFTKIIAANRMNPALTVTTGNKLSGPVLTVVGTREFSAPSEEADTILDQINNIPFASPRRFTWTMAQTLVLAPK